ncbi:hypothetical protein DPMN_011236 [Dreissena polymorpha]|uniref:Uncharacterized protein n=1 Tax=Dreissena polymorpha TaxID=45954 RepID=A0A9D4S1N5_DREPO|nr:hypothetical protein DPMN_011236 [Dreissena polymorpha]
MQNTSIRDPDVGILNIVSSSKQRGTESKADIDIPKKKVAKTNSQKYKESYREYWSCLGPSLKGKTNVHCSTCNIDFSCAHESWRQ